MANVAESYPVPIVAILFGAVMLVYGTNLGWALSEVAANSKSIGTGPSAVLLAGAAGIVLGVLALLGMHATTLIAASVIVYGAAAMLSGSASLQSLGSGTGGAEVPALGGLVAIVLGLLSLTGGNSPVLLMVAFLVLGSMIIISRTPLPLAAR